MNNRPYCMQTGWKPTIHGNPDAAAVIRYAEHLEADIRRLSNEVTQQDVTDAATVLSKTTRGRHAMRWLLGWLEDDGIGLDGIGQEAVINLLQGAWGQWAGSTRDAMREYVLPYEVDRR